MYTAHTPSHTIPLQLIDFILYRDSDECKGYTGIENLMGLLKKDVKRLIKDYRVYIPRHPERLKELQSLLLRFNIYWEQWSASSFCNLSPLEVSILNLYRKKQNYEWIAGQLDSTYDSVLAGFVNALRKLKTPETLNLFQQWKDFKHLNTQSTSGFLELPIEGLHHVFPHRVYTVLLHLGKNMGEILNKVTVSDLYKYKNFGAKAEKDLRAILKKHQCLHLLK